MTEARTLDDLAKLVVDEELASRMTGRLRISAVDVLRDALLECCEIPDDRVTLFEGLPIDLRMNQTRASSVNVLALMRTATYAWAREKLGQKLTVSLHTDAVDPAFRTMMFENLGGDSDELSGTETNYEGYRRQVVTPSDWFFNVQTGEATNARELSFPECGMRSDGASWCALGLDGSVLHTGPLGARLHMSRGIRPLFAQGNLSLIIPANLRKPLYWDSTRFEAGQISSLDHADLTDREGRSDAGRDREARAERTAVEHLGRAAHLVADREMRDG